MFWEDKSDMIIQEGDESNIYNTDCYMGSDLFSTDIFFFFNCHNWLCNLFLPLVFLISAPTIESSGEPGVLYLAKPLDACSTLENKVRLPVNSSSPFALIIRGGCSFEDKVRRAQVAGFKAAIVYDNEDSGSLIASNDFLHY